MQALLLARQRTGTGALGTILDQHPELFYTGEILHPSDTHNKLNFFTFLSSDPEHACAYANPLLREGLVQTYFNWVGGQTAPRRAILDVKYNSVHHWNHGWQGFFEQPWLIRHAIQQKIPILHLCRRNHAATYVSGRLADKNQVWHTQDKAAVGVRTLQVPPRELLNFIRARQREIALVREWLGSSNKVLTLEYEDMLDADGAMPETVASVLAGFLGVAPFTKLSPVFIKQAPTQLSESIENFSDVAVALRDTEFSWMLHAGR